MKHTEEQRTIIESQGDKKISARAGSGKTHTVIGFLERRMKARSLYLSFNRQNADEAKAKFKSKDMENAFAQTAHRLAYQHAKEKGKVSINKGIGVGKLMDMFNLYQPQDETHSLLLASNILSAFSWYCNSSSEKIYDQHYPDALLGNKSRAFAEQNLEVIYHYVMLLFDKMRKAEVEPTYDYLLKSYQLSSPKLKYDIIIFDEGQDASDAMLDIFMKQECRKIIVGDEHQSIYSWRFAVNALEKVGFPEYPLTRSFRFGNKIADTATGYLRWKEEILSKRVIGGLEGTDKDPDTNKSWCTVSRTNLGLIEEALAFVEEYPEVPISFEGDLKHYLVSDQGISVYDLVSLKNGKKERVRNELAKKLGSLSAVKRYAGEGNDRTLYQLVAMVEKYGSSLFSLLKSLEKKKVKEAEVKMAFSTVHRSKGLEFTSVSLGNDFFSYHELLEEKNNHSSHVNVNEEINLLYVGVTRSRGTAYLPHKLIP
jgi:superfamily I DNA/RNA helicase